MAGKDTLASITPSPLDSRLFGGFGSTEGEGATPALYHKGPATVFLGSRPTWEPIRCDCCEASMGYGDTGYEGGTMICTVCADSCYADYIETRTPGWMETRLAEKAAAFAAGEARGGDPLMANQYDLIGRQAETIDNLQRNLANALGVLRGLKEGNITLDQLQVQANGDVAVTPAAPANGHKSPTPIGAAKK